MKTVEEIRQYEREKKRKYRATRNGYIQMRMDTWKKLGIVGATYDKYVALLVAQNWQCAICGSAIDETAHLDHDHKTGLIRGVLCQQCNLLLGHEECYRLVHLHEFRQDAQKYLSEYEKGVA